ncbi:MAG TPA: glutaredoxin domain-containing protein [Vicinamibacterales bacterium]|jgi:glutaredoxin 3
MAAPQLELYGASGCPYTTEWREQLSLDGRDFVEYDVETDAAARARLEALTGDSRVPVIVDDGRLLAIGWGGRSCLV